jgi:NADH-quinone oxidoreductase subunit L
MGFLVGSPWLAVAVPFVLALLIALLGRAPRVVAPLVACLGPALVLGVGAGSLAVVHTGEAPVAPWTSTLASAGQIAWFAVGKTVLTVGWAVDSLAAIMLLVVGFVALMVMVFSAGYMAGDRGWARYYALLSLFTGSMTLLVIGNSLVTLFIGWELVGVCSYLLIGFWFEKPSAAAAAVKAFLTTRVGDIGLLIGLAVLWKACGTLAYTGIMAKLTEMGATTALVAGVCVAIGAIGKSAQFPLHAWLPDAMEGPTPISALIHAATMVAAGVYLVARLWPLFEAAPGARTLLLAVGVISAFGAACIGMVQRDIKRVLAYSTISQLGFMFAALGVGAWEVAFFHLVTHAAFKALLFLTSGSVIHGSGTQDLREMGGLRRVMPWTFVAWLVGVLALAGIPPLSGFFSKDLILDAVWASAPVVALFLFATTFLTGLYSARATRLAFFGAPGHTTPAEQGASGGVDVAPHAAGHGSDEHGSHGSAYGSHAGESPLSMLVPLGLLGVLAIVLGFVRTGFFSALGGGPEPLSVPLSIVAVGLALAGAAVGWALSDGVSADERTESRLGPVWTALSSGLGWDRLVDAVVVRPAVALSRIAWAVIDRWAIDGIVEETARGAGWLGGALSRAQTGSAQWYAAALVLGVAALLAASVWVGR